MLYYDICFLNVMLVHFLKLLGEHNHCPSNLDLTMEPHETFHCVCRFLHGWLIWKPLWMLGSVIATKLFLISASTYQDG